MIGRFDLLGYLASRGIPYALEGENVSEGWVGVKCPFCNDQKNHLGIHLQGFAISCFKCGEKGWVSKYLRAVEPHKNLKQIFDEFASKDFFKPRRESYEPTSQVVTPALADGLSARAKAYLRGRAFPYKMLQTKYQIDQFRPESRYKFRLFIPVYFHERLVTFTTRSYVNEVEPKYLHCPKRLSSLFAKETLYNIDHAKGGTAVVVEGPIDAWRIGDGAVATFGVIFTQKQIKLLRERFKRVFIIYDAEPEAQAQAQKLADTLACFSLTVHVVKLAKGDPGAMSTAEVHELRREIFGG